MFWWVPAGHDSPRALFASKVRSDSGRLAELIIKHPSYAERQEIHRKLLDLLDDLENHDAMN